MTLILRGELRERASRSEVAAGPLSLVVKPAGVRHADDYGNEPVVTCQFLLHPSVHGDVRWRDGLERWRWLEGGPAVRAALAVARELHRSPQDPELPLHGAATIMAALDRRQPSGAAPLWLDRAITWLEDGLASGAASLRVSEAAAAAGVHPVHLSRVFYRHFGCPVSTWIRRRRIQRAAEALARSRAPLSNVACDAGFADHSHMNRAFRRETHLLPATYRAFVQEL